jgi:fatty-acyl-CoA synthase
VAGRLGDPLSAGRYDPYLFRLFELVRKAALVFRRLGAGPGAPVAIFGPNTLWTQVALWGAELAGLACPINPLLNADSIIGLIRASGTRVAVIVGVNSELDVWARVSAAVREADPTIPLLDVDADEPSPGSMGRFEDLVRAEFDGTLAEPEPDSDASFYPTGGTTGAPKLTRHTHRNEAFVAMGASRMYDLQPAEVVLNGFPLFHVAGAFVFGLSSIAGGAAQLIPGRLGMRNRAVVGDIWRQADRNRITMLSAVPTVLSALLALPPPGKDTPIRVAYTGGSVLPVELADAFEDRTGIPVRNILGMTECSGMLTVEPFHAPRTPGSTGLRLPFTTISIEDLSTGAEAAPGEPGLVVVRGPHVSPGYVGRPAPNDTLRADGSLATGDLGRQDGEGRVFITGRAKDVIIRGSHNIDPGVIEDALLQHPSVALAAAIGMPDSYAGELPAVFVTLKPGAVATEAELAAFARDRVPEPAAQPKHIWILDEMPLTPVGKIFKPSLRAQAARYAVAAALNPLGVEVAEIVGGEQPGELLVKVGAFTPEKEMAMREAVRGMPIAVRFAPA